MLAKFIAAQAHGFSYQRYDATICHPEPNFKIDSNGLLEKQSSTDGAIQTVRFKIFQPCLLWLAHNRSLAGHLRERRIYHSMRLKYYWPHVASDAYTTVEKCRQCVMQGYTMKYGHHLTLFTHTAPPEFIAADSPGLFQRMKNCNRNIVMIRDWYS